MLRQTLPQSAREYAAAQRAESRRAVARSLVLWRQVGADFDPGWLRIAPLLLAGVEESQERVAAGALAYIPAVLEDTGQARAAAAFATPSAGPLVGVSGDGRPLDTLLYGAVTHSRERVAAGAGIAQALRSGGSWLAQAVSTVLSDTGRQGESLGMGVRPVGGYVRMLNPPSCSRCVILAGRWYPKSSGFQRHPRCDCRHIPAAEAVAGDITVDPMAYINSLTDAEQDAVLGKAGAEAVRNGADLNQVVNARRGMRSAQIGGRDVLITSEGTTRRGEAYRYLAPSGTTIDRSQTAMRRTRNGLEARTIERRVASRPRLMPETIQQIARDRDDYLRLLRVNGYLR